MILKRELCRSDIVEAEHLEIAGETKIRRESRETENVDLTSSDEESSEWDDFDCNK